MPRIGNSNPRLRLVIDRANVSSYGTSNPSVAQWLTASFFAATVLPRLATERKIAEETTANLMDCRSPPYSRGADAG